MENKIESLELEEMRQQMNVLKSQLEEQVQVNDELVIKQMRTSIGSFNRKGVWTLIVAIVGAYPLYIYCHRWGVSMFCYSIILIAIFMDALVSYYLTHMVRESDLQKSCFSELIDKLIRMRKGIRILTIADYILLVGILVLLFCQTFFNSSFTDYSPFDQTKIPVIFIVGAICGIYFGGKEMKKRIRQIDEMIRNLSKE